MSPAQFRDFDLLQRGRSSTKGDVLYCGAKPTLRPMYVERRLQAKYNLNNFILVAL
jgi:hypothetical protein